MVEETAVEHSASSMEIIVINFLDERNTKTAENKSTASGEVSTGNPRLKYGVSVLKIRDVSYLSFTEKTPKSDEIGVQMFISNSFFV